MADGRDKKGASGERFSDLVGEDVKRTSGSRQVTRRPKAPPSPGPQRDEAPVQFSIEVQGEEVTGIAPGADPAQVAQMRRGEITCRRSVDLHGLVAEQAGNRLRSEIAEAVRTGERCIRVIHGRGHGSKAGPVLKEALPDWLAALPHGRRVLGFCCARTLPGGTGATLVLLKKKRRSNRGS